MVTATEALRISQYSQNSLLGYVKNAIRVQLKDYNMRPQLMEKDRIYQREMDHTAEHLRALAANRAGNPMKMQNVTIPVVMPQVEATHGFFVETFLSSYPVFPVVSGPEYMPIAQQIDAVVGESAVRHQYVRHLSMLFRDGLKYNLMCAEVEWKTIKVYAVKTEATQDLVFGTPVVTDFAGNMLKRCDPYNVILDPRVAPADIHQNGDYAGYTELMTRIQLKNLFLELDSTLTMNADLAFSSATPAYSVPGSTGDSAQAYYVPEVNPATLRSNSVQTGDWLAWAGLDTQNKIKHQGMYEVTTMYIRVIPREHGINTGKSQGQNGVPQIFKVITVNSSVVIYVERKSNAHNYLPMVIGQPIEDGLQYQTKSMADNAAPYQFLASSLYNSALTSQRRKVYDRIVYDPSRINKKDIDNTDPVARIAIKESAYGKPIGESYEVMTYNDDGIPNILAMGRDVAEMGDVSSGQNRVQRGQFQKGNKTRHEFDTVMDKSDLRARTMAIVVESSFLQPIKHIIKMNILQYQPPQELFNIRTQAMVAIKPEELRKVAWEFQIADGVLPVSRLLNPELFEKLLQYAAGTAQLGQPLPYDLVSMGVYSLKLQGASWVDAFKIQQQPTQQPQQPQGPQNGTQQPSPQ